jgi:hypothetical protein
VFDCNWLWRLHPYNSPLQYQEGSSILLCVWNWSLLAKFVLLVWFIFIIFELLNNINNKLIEFKIFFEIRNNIAIWFWNNRLDNSEFCNEFFCRLILSSFGINMNIFHLMIWKLSRFYRYGIIHILNLTQNTPSHLLIVFCSAQNCVIDM